METSTALEFLRRHRDGVLTTIKHDGRPQLSNILYLVGDDDVVRISVTDDRAKTNNLRRDARASLHVTQDDFWAYCVVEADAALLPVTTSPDDPTCDALVEYYRTMSGEHPDWADYRRSMVAQRRLLVELTVTHAYGMLGT